MSCPNSIQGAILAQETAIIGIVICFIVFAILVVNTFQALQKSEKQIAEYNILDEAIVIIDEEWSRHPVNEEVTLGDLHK